VEPIRRLKAIAAEQGLSRLVPARPVVWRADRAARRRFGRRSGQGRLRGRRRGCSTRWWCRRPPQPWPGSVACVLRDRRCMAALGHSTAARRPSARAAPALVHPAAGPGRPGCASRRPADVALHHGFHLLRARPGRKAAGRSNAAAISVVAARTSSQTSPGSGCGPQVVPAHCAVRPDHPAPKDHHASAATSSSEMISGQPGPDQLALVLEVDVERDPDTHRAGDQWLHRELGEVLPSGEAATRAPTGSRVLIWSRRAARCPAFLRGH